VTALAHTREALLWDRRADGAVRCRLCAHGCVIRPGLRGICRVRENRDSVLVTLVAERVVAFAVDPIEKKPFFHFLPGTTAYSIATAGCNLRCRFCQNWRISQWPRERAGPPPGLPTSSRAIVDGALAARCRTVAYTYTEPTVFFELALETAWLAADAGLRNAFVTNGYMTAEALAMIAPVLDGASVDLKSFSDRYYRKVCGATLPPVLATIRRMRERAIWVEVTTLLVPGRNDSGEELRALAAWLADLDREMPWHVSAFSPAYRMLDVPPTPPASLHRAARIGREAGLRHVYTGNARADGLEDTACPGCGTWLVRRRGFAVVHDRVVNGACSACGTTVAGIWD
jgi:pyruvate formate lyase activating enzyme